MKCLGLFIILISISSFCASGAQAQESSIYLCDFKTQRPDVDGLRLKKYFDSEQGIDLGKIELIKDSFVIDSLSTQVLQIPLLDSQGFVQVWFAPSTLLDAQLSYDQGLRPFHATYKKNSERHELICSQLP